MRRIGLFAKHWQAGAVKTRLAASIGAAAAAELQRAFLEVLVARFADLGDERWLCYWPPGSAGAFAELAADRWQFWPQPGGDLGLRMAAFVEEAFAASCSAVVLIGADAPDLPRGLVQQAFVALGGCDVVLGPAEDGGYYLLGVARPDPPIFEDLPWSTSKLLPETLARLERAGWTHSLLPTWSDVDRLEDLRALSARLAAVRGDLPLERLRANVAAALETAGNRGRGGS